MTESSTSHEKARTIVTAALERKAERPVALDISQLTSFTEAFVVVSAGSDRQVRAIADEVVKTLKRAGDPPLGVEGLDQGQWVLIDCDDVICHVFAPDVREKYDLERLWHDGEPIKLDLPPQVADAGSTR
jgi:ribosome-associated protein